MVSQELPCSALECGRHLSVISIRVTHRSGVVIGYFDAAIPRRWNGIEAAFHVAEYGELLQSGTQGGCVEIDQFLPGHLHGGVHETPRPGTCRQHDGIVGPSAFGIRNGLRRHIHRFTPEIRPFGLQPDVQCIEDDVRLEHATEAINRGRARLETRPLGCHGSCSEAVRRQTHAAQRLPAFEGMAVALLFEQHLASGVEQGTIQCEFPLLPEAEAAHGVGHEFLVCPVVHAETAPGVHRGSRPRTHRVRIVHRDLGTEFDQVGCRHGPHDATAHNGNMGLAHRPPVGPAYHTRHDAMRCARAAAA